MSNTDRPVVEQAKKQSKRLLKLAQKSPLVINSLSDAQEVVAQLCGYTTWHAFSHASPSMQTNPLSQTTHPNSSQIQKNLGRCSYLPRNTCATYHHSDAVFEQINQFQKDVPLHCVSLYSKDLDAARQLGCASLSPQQITAAPYIVSPLGSAEFDDFTVQMVARCIVLSCPPLLSDRQYIQSLLASSIQDATRVSYMRTHTQLAGWSNLSPAAQSVLLTMLSPEWTPNALNRAQQLLLSNGLENDAWIVHVNRMPSLLDVFERMMTLESVNPGHGNLNTALVQIAKLMVPTVQFPIELLAPSVVFHVNAQDVSQDALMFKSMLLGHYREMWCKQKNSSTTDPTKRIQVLQCFDRIDGLFGQSERFRDVLTTVVREGRKNGILNLIGFENHDRSNIPVPDNVFWVFTNWIDEWM